MRLWVSNIIFSVVYLFFAGLLTVSFTMFWSFVILPLVPENSVLGLLAIPGLIGCLWLAKFPAKWLSPRSSARAQSKPDSVQESASGPLSGKLAQPSPRQK